MTLRTKFLAFVSATAVLAAGLSAGGLWMMERRYLREAAAEKTRLIEESVEKAALDALILDDPLSLVSYLRFLERQWPPLVFVRTEQATVGRPQESAIVRERIFPHPKTGKAVRVEIGLDPEVLGRDLAAAERRLARQLALVLAALLLVGGALTALWTLRLVRPIELLAEGAAAVGSGRLGVRLEHEGADELGALVAAFNRMSERLAELDLMKKDFVSSVTHELRSPVAAVESMLNVLLSRKTDDESREYLSRARTSLQRLSLLIDNLLDAAKIERGRLDVKPETVSLAPAVEEVRALFEARAAERGVALEADVSARTLRADPGALRRVLVNLVSNALKFTPSGGRVRIAAKAANGGVVLTVADTGRGMAGDETAKLFEKFVRSRSAAGTSGTGLGLYLVRQAVEAHGGKVSVESAPGLGTTFTTHWPQS